MPDSYGYTAYRSYKCCEIHSREHIMLRKPLDAIDVRILSELQRNSNLSNVELAERVGLSPSPCLARVRALEKGGVISRYVALLRPEAMGLGIRVFIQITLEKQVEQALGGFEAKMDSYPEVMECYLMTGDHDYLLRVVVRDMEELQRFIVKELSKTPG